jgi:aminoglycoside/choline kinase family phosphotransferase
LTDPRRDDPRLVMLRQWLADSLGWHDATLEPASADASFRRYFRVTRPTGTYVVMDAPPEREDVAPYLEVARMLGEIGVHGPHVLERDAEQGFLLLTDLGTQTYRMELDDPARADPLYLDAIDALVRIQARGTEQAGRLPPYDERLLRFEVSLYTDWLLGRHLGLEMAGDEARAVDAVFDRLVENALGQPQVFVHRDYHSRNLMVCPVDNPGILDFQDAVRGPLTYDLVSLLRDCYVAWPGERVRGWAREYRRRAAAAGVATGTDEATFLRWFDLMGVQRHLKASGIFARLWHRDGKPGYLPDVPRTLGYVVEACSRHPDLAPLGQQVSERVLPAVIASLEAGRR